jgi:DNA-binding MarR family transcriptional regulator
VRVTPAGKKALARLRAVHEKVDDDFFAPLSADERTTLHTLLLRLAAHHDPRYAPNGH